MKGDMEFDDFFLAENINMTNSNKNEQENKTLPPGKHDRTVLDYFKM